MLSFLGLVSTKGQSTVKKIWDKRFGGNWTEELTTIIQSNDGGIILGGSSTSLISGDKTQDNWDLLNHTNDYWIVKTDSIGNKLWDYRYGGNKQDMLYSLKQTSDNGYILAGRSMSGISGDKTQTNWSSPGTLDDYWMIKIDSMGIKQWDKRYGGTSEDWAYEILCTYDGGYLVGGESLSGANGDKSQPIQGYYDYWIVKTDSIGNKIWDKRFGGDRYDGLRSGLQTDNGGFILAGDSKSDIYGDKSQTNWDTTFSTTDYWVIKINDAGIKEWDKRIGGLADDHCHSIVQTIDGGYILAGISNSGIGGNKTSPLQGGWDYWIVKIDSNGAILWDKTFGGSLDENRDFFDNEFGNIISTNDGNFLISGNSKSNNSGDKSENNLGQTGGWIIKIDSVGNKLWDKTILTTGATILGSTIQLSDGCYQIGSWSNAGIAGYKTQNNWTGGTFYDYWTVKLCDCVAGELPASNFTSTYTSGCAPFCVTFSDNSDCYDSRQWIFPGGTPSSSTDQIPIVCYTTGGYFSTILITTNQYGSDTLIMNNYIHIRPDEPIINVAGNVLTSNIATAYQWYFSGSPINGATSQQYIANIDGYYSVCITDSTGCSACSDSIFITVSSDQILIENPKFTISPNPTTGYIDLSLFFIRNEQIQIVITDITNQIIFTSKEYCFANSFNKFIDLSNFPPGVYLIRVCTERNTIVKKVIKN